MCVTITDFRCAPSVATLTHSHSSSPQWQKVLQVYNFVDTLWTHFQGPHISSVCSKI